MRTMGFFGMKWAFRYCPRCSVVYYNLKECKCDFVKEEKSEEVDNG